MMGDAHNLGSACRRLTRRFGSSGRGCSSQSTLERSGSLETTNGALIARYTAAASVEAVPLPHLLCRPSPHSPGFHR